MKLVLELTDMQLHTLESCIFAGRIQAADYMREHRELGDEEKAALWERMLDSRRELGLTIRTAIEDQDGIGSLIG
jgi:hypothetical protein